MTRAEAFTQSLYEDANLREDLTDEEATPLFDWAAGIANSLDDSSATDEDFEQKTKQLRKVIKGVNRLVGQRSYAPADAHQQQLDDLRSAAQMMGITPPDEPIVASADQSTAYMGALLAQMQLSTATKPAQAEPSVPAHQDQPELPDTGEDFRGWRSWLPNLDKALSDDDEI